jgi:hypothetical protein
MNKQTKTDDLDDRNGEGGEKGVSGTRIWSDAVCILECPDLD